MKRNKLFSILTIIILVTALSACGKGISNEDIVTSDDNIDSVISDTVSASEDITNDNSSLSANGEYIVNDISFDSNITADTATNNVVFYEIFVGSFSDSDGDGIGDLRGIINRFDYLNDGNPESGLSLGVEGIWLTPIFRSPSYHKYDVTDYYEIDPSFGTMDDLIELTNLCHERGVKIILDMVINHTSTNNSWYRDFVKAQRDNDVENPFYDFYTYSESASAAGRTFYKISEADNYYEGNFSKDMPELNYDSDIVRNNVLDVAKYYLNEINVDGFRFDAAKYIYFGETKRNVEFWDWYINELKAIKANVYTVAEVWDSDSMIFEYETAINCFDFTMSQSEGQIALAAKKGDVNKLTAYTEGYINKVKSLNPTATIIPFISNHDMDRAAGFLNVTSSSAFTGANLLILGPGSPFIYYGEEIGMKGSRGSANTDANRRLKMRWGDEDTVKNPEGSSYEESKQTNGTLMDQISEENSLYTYYKRLIMIRKANPEIYLGEYNALAFSDTNVGGFVSDYNGSKVCVIHNTTGSEKTVDLLTATDINFTSINAIAGSYIEGSPYASLDGSKLTLSAQTSVVLRQ